MRQLHIFNLTRKPHLLLCSITLLTGSEKLLGSYPSTNKYPAQYQQEFRLEPLRAMQEQINVLLLQAKKNRKIMNVNKQWKYEMERWDKKHPEISYQPKVRINPTPSRIEIYEVLNIPCKKIKTQL